MAESDKKQHEQEVKTFNEIKEKSKEENKDFVEFLQAKGIKAKFHVVVENVKKGIRESKEKTIQQIANSNNYVQPIKSINAEELNKEFNEFLKLKGLSNEYKVEIVETK